jgi:hypothetical protein
MVVIWLLTCILILKKKMGGVQLSVKFCLFVFVKLCVQNSDSTHLESRTISFTDLVIPKAFFLEYVGELCIFVIIE